MSVGRYTTHVPLETWQKTTLAVLAGIGSILNPHRADLVAASNETLGAEAFRRVHDAMTHSQNGRRILKEKPVIADDTLKSCRQMKSGSLGASYAAFMDQRQFKPSDRPPVRFVDDPEVAYVALRYRQVHDLWHVLFECPTNMTGEVAVKIIEGIQLGLPNALLASVVAPILIKPKDRRDFFTGVFPLAVRSAFKATDLMSVYYEEHFEEDLKILQRRWSLSKVF